MTSAEIQLGFAFLSLIERAGLSIAQVVAMRQSSITDDELYELLETTANILEQHQALDLRTHPGAGAQRVSE